MALNDVAPVRIGVDIGGTFTDLQIYDARTGAIVGYKTPTTPEDPSIGLMTGIKEAAAKYNFTLPDVGFLLHGTTIATNAILERKLPKAALVTTAGFEDVLEIGRHVRREVYALSPQQPPTLIPRDCRIGIAERIRSDGRVELPLTPAALENLAVALDRINPVSVAVCLMNSYLNPEHEQRIAEYLAKTRPALKVSCSSALSAEIREYERTSTTVLNARADSGHRGLPRQAYAPHGDRRVRAAAAVWCNRTAGCAPPGPRRWSRCGCCFRGRRAAARPARC